MSAPTRTLAKIKDTVAWTYACLSLSMVSLGCAFQIVYTTVANDDWQMSQGFPAGYYVLAIISLAFVGLAKLGKPTNAPKVTIGALLGLMAIVIAMLSFDFQSLILTPPFWITLVGGIVTYISLFIGWRSDAAEKRLRTKVADLEAEVQIKDEAIAALQGKSPSLKGFAVLLAGVISVTLLGAAAKRFDNRDGGQK
jgi:hypothetical protein